MQKKPFGTPCSASWTAVREQYHAVASINEHGVIEHTRALAHQLLKAGCASDEWQALDMARAQVQGVRQIAQGLHLHQLARRELQSSQENHALHGDTGLARMHA